MCWHRTAILISLCILVMHVHVNKPDIHVTVCSLLSAESLPAVLTPTYLNSAPFARYGIIISYIVIDLKDDWPFQMAKREEHT